MYADYILFGAFQWRGAYRLLDDSDPVAAWRDRMPRRHGGSEGDGYPV
jgi:hypothetical protein